MRNTRFRKSALVVSAIALVLAACGGSDEAAAPAAPAPAPSDSGDGGDGEVSVPDSPADGVTATAIKVGWMGDLTGPTASAQSFNQKGIQAYFDYINAQGDTLGRQLELVVKDDEYSAELGISNFTSLLNDERVIAINNLGGSQIIGALLDDAERADLPLISIAQTTTEQLKSPVSFHTLAHYFDMADVAVSRAIGALGGPDKLRIGVAHLEVPSGLEWDEGIQKAVAVQGGTYVGAIPIPIAAPDAGSFAATVRSLIESEGMNYLALHGAPFHGLFAVNSLAAQGIEIPIVGMQGIASLNVYQEGDPAQTVNTEAVHSFVSFADDTPGGAIIREFLAGDGSAYAEDAKQINFTHGWVGGMIIREAILRAGETGSLTRSSLLEALSGTFETDGLTCVVDWSTSNHSPCAAPFSYDGSDMRIVGSFDDYADVFRRDYTIGSS
jgi:branched-chain amino acid transport system substrate-binding protein